jgi:diguanylate cyclase (GGDEF)-like protein
VQIRRLSTRIAVAFALLLLAVQVASLMLINSVLSTGANRDIQQELNAGERIFNLIREERSRRLVQDASVLALDFGFREATATNDRGTLTSVLGNHGKRINADVMLLAGLDQKVMADTLHPDQAGVPFAFPELLKRAQEQGQATGFVLIDGQAYELVVVPVKAPVPIAWLATGLLINDHFAKDLRSLISLDVSFMTPGKDNRWRVLATTFGPEEKSELPVAFAARGGDGNADITVALGDVDYVTRLSLLGDRQNGLIVAVLQQSMQKALATLNKLQITMLTMGVLSLLATIVAAILIARNMTRPLNALSAFAQRIEQGDYSQPVAIHRQDEIGQLASAFNHMRTGIAAREARITDLANQDVLTGLPNRTLLRDRLEQAIKASKRSGETPTLLIMDLDRFKEVNDSLGHHVGDLLLQQVSQRLLATVMRESDTVARLGGDEFAILLPASDGEGGTLIARKLIDVLEQPILLDGHQLVVAASIGIAVYPEHGDEINTLMRRADTAMYAAKRSNSGFAVYDPRIEDQSEQQLSLMAELRQAVEQDQLLLYYQPKVDLATGTVRHVEALLRWQHPVRGFVPPDQFIPFAERTGFIKVITRWVIAKAMEQGEKWQASGLAINISINVSARDLVNPELSRVFDDYIIGQGKKLHWLSLEITESIIMADPAHALSTLEYLRSLGLRLSIDDFGTGYSSLAYLKKLPVDELKIDKSFVVNMQNDRDDAAIVQSTISLGHNMGLKVVAEGVEDAKTCDALRQLGCDYAQGYLFSRALAAADFETWMAQSPWGRFKPHLVAANPAVQAG